MELEKLMLNQRSAKINVRRATIAVDSHSSNQNNPRALFKKIVDTPFSARRRSVSTAKRSQTQCTVSQADMQTAAKSKFRTSTPFTKSNGQSKDYSAGEISNVSLDILNVEKSNESNLFDGNTIDCFIDLTGASNDGNVKSNGESNENSIDCQMRHRSFDMTTSGNQNISDGMIDSNKSVSATNRSQQQRSVSESDDMQTGPISNIEVNIKLNDQSNDNLADVAQTNSINMINT